MTSMKALYPSDRVLVMPLRPAGFQPSFSRSAIAQGSMPCA
jgi:hypothetical protein